jgi:hypothetical protein
LVLIKHVENPGSMPVFEHLPVADLQHLPALSEISPYFRFRGSTLRTAHHQYGRKGNTKRDWGLECGAGWEL